MYILTAYKDNEKIFTITKSMTKNQLLLLRNTSKFTCPQCETPLRLKIGKVVTPHFAHIVLTNCLTSFSEKESPTHLIGKQQLAEFFTRVGCKVSVEAYLPKISQRPDLLVRNKRNIFAIEFQCSVIPVDDIEKRTAGYLRVKIPSIWLLRTPKNIQLITKGISIIKLSKFMQAFIKNLPSSSSTIITYDPTTANFFYFSQLVHISGSSFLAKIRALSIEQQTFPFAQVKILNREEGEGYWKLFKNKRLRFLQNRIRSSSFGVMDRFLKNCYENKILPENLPLYIGFPIQDSQVIQAHLVEWQFALICALKQHHIDFLDITDKWLESFILTQCKVTDFEKAITVIEDYCKFLNMLDFNINLPISAVFISESRLLEYFEQQIVAKPCEN
ncbi:MAG: competence protein CoiA family protein [Paenisporosarcina sp.]